MAIGRVSLISMVIGVSFLSDSELYELILTEKVVKI